MFLHLKSGETTFTRKALRKLNRAIKRYPLKKKPVVFTSNKTVLRKMAKYKWAKGFLCKKAGRKKVRDAIDYAADHGCRYLLASYRLKHKPTRPVVRYGHSKKLVMVYYGIRYMKRVRRVFRKGGDYIVTDKIFF